MLPSHVCSGRPGQDPACEAVSEFPHHGAVSPVQYVEAAAQVDDRQACMGGHERQHIVELVRCIGVHLGRSAHLGEAQPGELEQRIVPIDASLEQGMNVSGRILPRGDTPGTGVAGTLSGTIHDPHFAALRSYAAADLLFASLCPSQPQSEAGPAVLGCPRRLVRHPERAIGSPRHRPSLPLQLRAGAVMTHAEHNGQSLPWSSSHVAVRADGTRSGRPHRCCTADR